MKNVNLFFLAIAMLFSNMSMGQESKKIDQLFKDWTSDKEIKPGLAISVIKNQKVIYEKAFGYANLEYGIKIDNNSVFDMASLAKQFTGFAIAKLIYEEKISKEDKVQKFLPELKNLDPEMKLSHLIHHSSGLRDIGELFGIGHYGSELTSDVTLDIMSDQKELNFPVGKESDYSNTNYVLLAIIVERVTGETFRNWCQQNIFTPLNMNETFANDNTREIIPNRVMAYHGEDEEFTYMQNNGMSLIGSSAIFSSINDMTKWSMELQDPKLFAPIIELMKSKGTNNDGESIDYGYGVGLAKYHGRELVAHTGGTPSGFNTVISILPTEQISVVVLSNWGNLDLVNQFVNPILDELLGIDPEKENKANAEIPARVVVELSNESAEKFVGTYLFNGHMKVEIKRSGNKLTIKPEGNEEMGLKTLSETEVDFPDFRSTLKFTADASGKYMTADIYQGKNIEGKLERIASVEGALLKTENYVGTYYNNELDMYFKIVAHDGNLVAKDPKHGETTLTRKSESVFGVNGGFAHGIVFEKNREGKVERFLLSSGSRVRNLKFKKVLLVN